MNTHSSATNSKSRMPGEQRAIIVLHHVPRGTAEDQGQGSFKGLPVGTGEKGKGKSKAKFKANKGSTYSKKRLADRIASSTCRKSLQPGHWKRECPNPPHPSFHNISTEMITMTVEQSPVNYDHGELLADLPENTEIINLTTIQERVQMSFKLRVRVIVFIILISLYIGSQATWKNLSWKSFQNS